MKILTGIEKDIFDLTSILYEQEGKQFLLQVINGSFEFKTFSKLESFDNYTDHFKLTFENGSNFEVLTNELKELIHKDEEPTRNNTKSFTFNTTNNTTIHFEYEL